jgi:triphosphoribosyl-dephospho-CoA synthase
MQSSLLIADRPYDAPPGEQRSHRLSTSANRLASLARQALIAEAQLTPKPGLVDRRGSGSHCDLSLKLMTQSAMIACARSWL